MIEVVFSESAKGAMKVAKNYKKENFINSSFAYIGKKPSRKELEVMFEGEAIGGKSSDVLGICFNLDVGSISENVISEKRKKIIFDMFNARGMINENNYEMGKMYWNQNIKDLDKLKKLAENGEHIRLWYSDSPYSLCGFYFVNYILQSFSCKVSLIKLPKYNIDENGKVVSYSSWGELSAGKLYKFQIYEKEVTQVEKHYFASKWKELVKEDGSIRALINGKLSNVGYDFYDRFIKMSIPNTEFTIGKLVCDVLMKYELKIGDWFLAQRIREMIQKKELLIVSENDYEYAMVLKRNHDSI